MIILKLGGSVITNKESEKPEVNFKNLRRISAEIKRASPSSILIVHGAGSFGHPFAKEYSIGSRVKDEIDFQKKRIGFSVTQNWVKKLNTIVCDALIKEGIPAVSLQPSSFIKAINGRIRNIDLSITESYIKEGFVPVTYGDVVLDSDRDRRFTVISGDQLINCLSLQLSPERVILGTDVDGVFTRNPKKHPDARLLEVIRSLDDLELLEGTENTDVTGGMIGKLSELLLLAEKGIKSEIINAGVPGNIERALRGKAVRGTIIR